MGRVQVRPSGTGCRQDWPALSRPSSLFQPGARVGKLRGVGFRDKDRGSKYQLCIHIYIHIYIYIERERELWVCVYVYIYIHIGGRRTAPLNSIWNQQLQLLGVWTLWETCPWPVFFRKVRFEQTMRKACICWLFTHLRCEVVGGPVELVPRHPSAPLPSEIRRLRKASKRNQTVRS